MPTLLARPAQPRRRREITGRTVLIAFVAFFAVVGTVNAIMLRAATSTFGGVETASSYKAGLEFKNEIAAARAQDGSGWKVDAALTRGGLGGVTVELSVLDRKGGPPADLTVGVRFAHPNDARRDRAVETALVAPGRFRGTADVQPGQWDLVIDILAGERRAFRSKSRVVIR